MNKEFKKLSNIAGWQDIDAALIKIQRSFNIKFDGETLKSIDTLGALCDVIANQINREHADTCTTQHAFYLLRNAIAASTGTDKCSIVPHSKLSKLFPREDRQRVIGDLNRELGFEIDLLQPKQWVVGLFGLLLLASFIGLFYNWQIAAAGCLASVLGLKLAGKFGKEIHLKTVGDLANKISRESNLKIRRSQAVNKNEIEQKVIELFGNDLNLEPIVLRRAVNE